MWEAVYISLQLGLEHPEVEEVLVEGEATLQGQCLVKENLALVVPFLVVCQRHVV